MQAKLSRHSASSQRIAFVAWLLLASAVIIGCGGTSFTNGNVVGLGPGVNNGMLSGTYAFTFSGNNGSAFIAAAGSFSADGQGNISNGLEDVNASSGSVQPITFSARYSIGADGRGTALLTPNFLSCSTWQVTMLNSSHGLMTCFDTKDTASGTIDIQDRTAFTTPSIAGSYVFGLSGVGLVRNNSSGALVTAGDLRFDGRGHITGGEMDVNDNLNVKTDLPLTGTYAVAANGRGTATLTSNTYATQNFAFYVVNVDDVKFVETDAQTATTPMVVGEVVTQAPPPYSLATLKGGYAFIMSGVDFAGFAFGRGGVVTADGAGRLNSGLLDLNDGNGGFISLSNPLVGNYSFSPSGRFSASLVSSQTLQLALYPAQNGTIDIIEIDGNNVTGGMAKAQAGAPFSDASDSGAFAVNFTGTLNPFSSAVSEEDVTGQLSFDGSGGLLGTLDINNGQGGLIPNLALNIGSTYNMNANGYGGAAINTASASLSLHMYQIDPNTALFLDIDPLRLLTGVMAKQQ